MDPNLVFYIVAMALGIIGGLSANFFPASGKAALILSLMPPAGIGLSLAFC